MTATRKPTHHPACHHLVRYAAGTLSEGMRILIASHIALCPACRQEMQTYETEAGLGLENLPPEAMDARCLENLMTKIDENGPPACIDVTVPPPALPDPRYPEPVRVYSGARGEHLSWLQKDGMKEGRSPVMQRLPALRFVTVENAAALKSAIAEKTALLLVLDGALRLNQNDYAKGDIVRGAALITSTITLAEPLMGLIMLPEKSDQPSLVERLMFTLCGDPV